MASGVINGRTSNQYIISKIEWTANAITAENKSAVMASLYYKRTNTGYTTYGEGTFTLEIGSYSQTVKKTVSIGDDWVLVMSAGTDVAHNEDGTKITTISATGEIPGTSLAQTTFSGSATLDTIPRASTLDSISYVNSYFTSKLTYKYTPKSASYYNKLTIYLNVGGTLTTIKTINLGKQSVSQKTGTVTLSSSELSTIYNKLPNTNKGTLRFTFRTYSDSAYSKEVGSASYKELSRTIPDNTSTKPTVSMSIEPIGSLPSAFAGLHIQGLTKAKATISAECKYGSSVKEYLMRVDAVYYYEKDALTSGYFSVAGSRTVYGYATDKRGHTGEVLVPIDVLPYDAPRLESVTATRCDANGNVSDNGTSLKISATRVYSPVVANGVQKNFCEIRYRYSNGTSYSGWTTILGRSTTNTNAVTTGALLDGGLSLQSSYTVHIRAIDDIGRYADTYVVIPTEKVFTDENGARNSIGFGKYAERNNALDSAWDYYANGHKVTGLPTPTSDSDAVPMSYVDRGDIKISKSLNTAGWYEIGVLSPATPNDMCAVATLTIGGVFVNNQVNPSMLDLATGRQYYKMVLRIPSTVENQISKIGITPLDSTQYHIYAYYNSSKANTVAVNIHTHMGVFTSKGLEQTPFTDSTMFAITNLKS